MVFLWPFHPGLSTPRKTLLHLQLFFCVENSPELYSAISHIFGNRFDGSILLRVLWTLVRAYLNHPIGGVSSPHPFAPGVPAVLSLIYTHFTQILLPFPLAGQNSAGAPSFHPTELHRSPRPNNSSFLFLKHTP